MFKTKKGPQRDGVVTNPLKQGIAQQGQARQKVALTRWKLRGPGVMDERDGLPVMAADDVEQVGTSEIMVKCNWLKCSPSN